MAPNDNKINGSSSSDDNGEGENNFDTIRSKLVFFVNGEKIFFWLFDSLL